MVADDRELAEAERLADVVVLDPVAGGQVGDRAGDAEGAVEAAGAQPQAVDRRDPRAPGGRSERAPLDQVGGGQPGVLAAVAAALERPGGEHPAADLGGGLGGGRPGQLAGGEPLDLHVEVDPVEQRARQPGGVAVQVGQAAAAGEPRVAQVPARAGIGRRHQGEAGREADAGHRPDHRHRPVLQRLAERLAGRPGELGQLVEEEHPMVGQADLAGAGDVAAADQAGDRDGVVGGPERPRRDQAGARAEEPGRREHPGDLERLVALQRRQQAGQPPGQHRLAGAGRADEEEVVAAGGGDLQRAAGNALAAHVGEVGDPGWWGGRRGAGPSEVGPAGQPLPDLAEGGRPDDAEVRDKGGLGQVGLGDDQEPGGRPPGGQGGRQHAADGADVAGQAKLADGPQAVQPGRRDRAGRGEQPDRDRQVEAGAVLGQVGRGQGDGHAAVRPLIAGVAERRPDPVAGLEHGRAAEADHGHRGEATADVDLDPDRVSVQPDQGGGRQPGQHG